MKTIDLKEYIQKKNEMEALSKDQNEWSEYQCAYCKAEFEEPLEWTNGKAYFCDECMTDLIEGRKKLRKGVHTFLQYHIKIKDE